MDNKLDLKVNYHINEKCNYDCGFCFSRTHSCSKKCIADNKTKEDVIKALGKSKYVTSINFAGGEPLLEEHIVDYLRLSRECGLEANLITNGSLLFHNGLLHKVLPYLSMIGISFHSFIPEIRKAIGFCDNKGKAVSFKDLKEICNIIKKENNNCKIKINVVVNHFNKDEILIKEMEEFPIDRLKFLRCQSYDNNEAFLVTDEEWEGFLANNNSSKIHIVRESKMDDSYIMLDPIGRIKEKNKDDYSYTKSILEVPFDVLFPHLKFSEESYKLNHKE